MNVHCIPPHLPIHLNLCPYALPTLQLQSPAPSLMVGVRPLSATQGHCCSHVPSPSSITKFPLTTGPSQSAQKELIPLQLQTNSKTSPLHLFLLPLLLHLPPALHSTAPSTLFILSASEFCEPSPGRFGPPSLRQCCTHPDEAEGNEKQQ